MTGRASFGYTRDFGASEDPRRSGARLRRRISRTNPVRLAAGERKSAAIRATPGLGLAAVIDARNENAPTPAKGVGS